MAQEAHLNIMAILPVHIFVVVQQSLVALQELPEGEQTWPVGATVGATEVGM
jgi:hypothetical protein